MINTLFISDKNIDKLSSLYLSHSSGFLHYIQKKSLYSLYSNVDPLFISIDKHDESSYALIEMYRATRKRINDFCSEEHAKAVLKEKSVGNAKNKLALDEFLIELVSFPTKNEPLVERDEGDDFISISNLKDDVNFRAYNSTLNFIDHLCDISFQMGEEPRESQPEFLFKELYEINLKLPGLVYLPFLKDSTRNYMICHISLPETKIFRTKTRAPIMLTFELIRLDEVTNELKKAKVRDYKVRDRSHSISSNHSRQYSKIKDTIMMLGDSDISISKPVRIGQPKKPAPVNTKKPSPFTSSKTTSEKLDDDLISRNTMMQPHFSKEFEKKLEEINEEKEEDDKINNIRRKFKMRDDPNKKSIGKISLDEENNIRFAKDEEISIDTRGNSGEGGFTNKMRSATVTSGKGMSLGFSKGIEEEKEEDIAILAKPEEEIRRGSIEQEELKNVFGELFASQHLRIKETSLFGNFTTHQIFKAIIKTNEDLRQEQFATQLINEFYQIFQIEKVKCWLNPYEIIATGNNSGLIEMVPDTLSLDQLKQKTNNMSLRDFYLHYWGNGDTKSPQYKEAMKNYVRSLAGYSLVCYFLQIKDRHNGNILIDAEGHLIHIDFGFLLSNAPGKGLKFENAPFKLTDDMVGCLGGIDSDYFKKFQKRLKKGFVAVSKNRNKIIMLVEMMWCGHGKNLPCFQNQQMTITDLKNRLYPRPNMKKSEKYKLVDDLIGQSVDNWRTRWYDIFQYQVQGIFY